MDEPKNTRLKPGPKAHHSLPERPLKLRSTESEHAEIMESLPNDTRARALLLLQVVQAAKRGETLKLDIIDGQVVANAPES